MNMKNSTLNPKNGFTLLELLIALSIIGILGAVGIPSYSKMQENSSFSSGFNNLNSAYRIARAEAVKTSSPMVIKPGGDGGNNWSDGWKVENELTTDIIFQAPALKGDWTVSGSNVNSNADGENKIRFLGDGSFDTTTVGSLMITNVDNSKMKEICILRSAQSQVIETGSCP